MANAMLTLLDIAKMKGSDPVVGLVEEANVVCPEVRIGAARTIKGISYKTLVRTALPSVGFRGANEGTATTKSIYENRSVDTFVLNPQIEMDKAVADSDEDGYQAVMGREAIGHMNAAVLTVCKQFYYGLANDAKGFPGLIDVYDSTNMVQDAGGTTDDTASSVWLVRFGLQAVQWVWGNQGELLLSDVSEIRVTDASGYPYTAYRQEIMGRPGLQVVTPKAVVRIKKLTADSGKGLTDTLLGKALAMFPVGLGPNAIFASPRSLEQLRASRTATNATGAPAPTPTDYSGVPIHATEAIKNTEKLAL